MLAKTGRAVKAGLLRSARTCASSGQKRRAGPAFGWTLIELAYQNLKFPFGPSLSKPSAGSARTGSS
jgi:hypothetical protein